MAKHFSLTITDTSFRYERNEKRLEEEQALEDDPVSSFRELLGQLTTIVRNRVRTKGPGAEEFEMISSPTPLEAKALSLLSVKLKV